MESFQGKNMLFNPVLPPTNPLDTNAPGSMDSDILNHPAYADTTVKFSILCQGA